VTTAHKSRRLTIEEWLAQPEEKRYELIDGELVERASPDFEHGTAQLALAARIHSAFHGRIGGGGGGPGGWWIASEVDVELDGNGYRPDLAGWRRERVPEPIKSRPVRLRPDWICEVVSESNATTDTIRKIRLYHRAGVPHYWLLDPRTKTLVVHRHAREGYQIVLVAEAGETVRAEPFDAIELNIAELFDM
jgi:Uma2 family endonuclease